MISELLLAMAARLLTMRAERGGGMPSEGELDDMRSCAELLATQTEAPTYVVIDGELYNLATFDECPPTLH